MSSLKVADYKQFFIDGLHRLLWQYNDFPTRVVLAANATYSAEIFFQFNPTDIADAIAWGRRSHRALINTRIADIRVPNPENLNVIAALETSGITNNLLAQTKTLQPGLLSSFNLIRGFRPKGTAADRVTSLDFKYDPNSEDAFFEQHFLQTECFRNVELGGETVKLFYNKFPLLNFHGLLIPGNYRQSFNSKQDHVKKDLVQWIWGVLAEAEGAFTIGFNPFGGYASRNQLHFQISLDPQEFGITDPVWDINGGDQQYPAHVDLCKSPDELQSWLDAVYTQDNAAFNLLIIKEKHKGKRTSQSVCLQAEIPEYL